MKRMLFASLLCLGLTASAAVPRVSDVAMTPFGKCRISYTLSEAAGIVTFDILTNGVSIGVQNLTNAVGDVNRLVQPGRRVIRWDARTIWPGHAFKTPCVTARVTVWPENAPPDWIAIDLTKEGCPVSYYASEAELPWGKVCTNKKYKGDVFLMRKIRASHVLSLMGSPESEANRIAGRETRRMCTLTNDFYMAIFPTTVRQYDLLMNGPTATATSLVPVTSASYNMLRYASNNWENPTLPINFPSATDRTQIGSSSLLQSFRNRTGLVLDLPTSAQWEFACRAGMVTPINWGSGTMDNLGTVCSPDAMTYEVGSFACNSWYLYDMIGNVYEWCLDYFEDDITAEAVTDPTGPLSRTDLQRKIRGCHAQRIHKRAAFFSGSKHTQIGFGFRLCITLP